MQKKSNEIITKRRNKKLKQEKSKIKNDEDKLGNFMLMVQEW